MTKCEICGVEYKRLTQSHLKAHNIALQEYNELYEPEKYQLNEMLNFINDYYITTRYRWLLYTRKGDTITVDVFKNAETKQGRTYKLNDGDIKKHLNGKCTIGIYFMKEPDASKLIGLDLDIMDTDLLERIFTALFTYGIERKNILMSFSGNKGYHIDIFLDGLLDKGIIRKFYEILLHDLSVDDHTLELRGGDGRGYKLPFGYSNKTGNYCYPCNEHGTPIGNMESINGIEKLDIQVIANAIELNEILPRINESEAKKKEELRNGIRPLGSYDGGREIEAIERMLQEGIHHKGNRHNAVLKVAMYCKTILRYCAKEAIEFINRWIDETWTEGAGPQGFRRECISTVKKVYEYDYNLLQRYSDKKSPSEAEMQEIMSVKTGNKLETDSLQSMYFAFRTHSRQFANPQTGKFYITFKQIVELTGSRSPNGTIKKRIDKLMKLGKLERFEPREKYKEGTCISNPIYYKLSVEIPDDNESTFIKCENYTKCKDCMHVTYGCLVENKPIPEGRQCKIIEFPISIDG